MDPTYPQQPPGSSLPPPPGAGAPPPPGSYVPPAPGAPPPSGGGRGSKTALIVVGVVALVAIVGGAIAFFATRGGDETATVGSVDDVRSAVGLIAAAGTSVDPVEGLPLAAEWWGSGFFIDDAGTMVTNNHVVTGAATLKVTLEGEDTARTARVIGVSECNDLAVIQVDVDGPTPYLEWYEAAPTTGLEVWAAGYPSSVAGADEEYSLTKGIVSRESAPGDVYWASVENTIQHDAQILGGNSGGPLVTEAGQVVAVNYSGLTETDEFFSIPASVARPVVEEIVASQGNVDSIGINGEAFVLEDGTSGIFVSSVESGSPADEVGIEPGDIITTFERLPMAQEGTMAEYCDVLRSHDATDQLAIEVFRPDTQEVLEGELNGTPLEVTFSFEEEFEDEVVDDTTTTGYTYTQITDDSGRLSVSVPVEWSDVDGTPVDINGVQSPSVWAAPDLAAFNETWDVPGMKFTATDQFDPGNPGGLLDQAFDLSGACTYGGRFDYSDPLYTGVYDIWEDCGGTTTDYFVVAAAPPELTYLAIIEVQAVTDIDLEALDEILNTFVVTG